MSISDLVLILASKAFSSGLIENGEGQRKARLLPILLRRIVVDDVARYACGSASEEALVGSEKESLVHQRLGFTQIFGRLASVYESRKEGLSRKAKLFQLRREKGGFELGTW